MELLADTHILLWWEWQSSEMPAVALAALRDPANRMIVSAATVWEIAIKRNTGRLKFDGDVIASCKASGFEILPIEVEHADLAGTLPLYHTDPFDRMLIAQARIEGLVLVTQDRKLAQYGVPILGMS